MQSVANRGISMNVHTGGSTIVTTEGHTVNQSPTKEELKTIWQVYQSHVCQQPINPFENISERLRKIEQILKMSNCVCTEIPGELNSIQESPKEYLELAQVLHSQIKGHILSQVTQKQQFTINNHTFNVYIDEAEKNVILIFQDVFNSYFEKEDWENAFKALAKIKYTTFGTQGYIRLAIHCFAQDFTHYFGQEYGKMAVRALNSIKNFSKELNEIKLMLLDIEKDVGINILIETIPLLDEKVKVNIIKVLIDKLLVQKEVETCEDLISLIKDKHAATEEYKKMIYFYVIQHEMSNVLKIIERISDDCTRNEEYKKIAAFYVCRNEIIPDALNIIILINDDYIRNEEYKKAIQYYIIYENDFTDALTIIKLINDEYARSQEYIKIVDAQLARGNIEGAKKTVQLIEDDYTKQQQQAKLNFLHMSNQVRELPSDFVPYIKK